MDLTIVRDRFFPLNPLDIFLETITITHSNSTPQELSFTMPTDYQFQGWMGLDKSADKGNMKWQEYEPKMWEETDVDIQES